MEEFPNLNVLQPWDYVTLNEKMHNVSRLQ